MIRRAVPPPPSVSSVTDATLLLLLPGDHHGLSACRGRRHDVAQRLAAVAQRPETARARERAAVDDDRAKHERARGDRAVAFDVDEPGPAATREQREIPVDVQESAALMAAGEAVRARLVLLHTIVIEVRHIRHRARWNAGVRGEEAGAGAR